MVYKTLFVMISVLIFLRPHPDFIDSFLATYLADLIIISIILFNFLIIKKNIYPKHRI